GGWVAGRGAAWGARGTGVGWEGGAPAPALAGCPTRQHESLERQAHATLMGAIVAGAHPDLDEVAARARALGVQVAGRQLLAIVITFRHGGRGLPAHAVAAKVADALADACRGERIPALVGPLGEESVGA